MRRVLYLNHTGEWHFGCRLVNRQLLGLLAESGGTIVECIHGPTFDSPLERTLADVDLVVLNGEGTLHHRRERIANLLELARRASAAGKPTYLVNSVLEAMEWADLSFFDLVAVRESLSFSHARALLPPGKEVILLPDAGFTMQVPTLSESRSGVLVTDSADSHWNEVLNDLARAHGYEMVHFEVHRSSFGQEPEDLARKFGAAELVVTGRFHGILFALLTGTPVVAVPSNSWKSEGMMADFGLSEWFVTSPARLHERIRAGGGRSTRSLSPIRTAWEALAYRIIAG